MSPQTALVHKHSKKSYARLVQRGITQIIKHLFQLTYKIIGKGENKRKHNNCDLNQLMSLMLSSNA